MSEPWAQPVQWSKEDQNALWDYLLRELDNLIKQFLPTSQAQIEKIVTLSATLAVPVSSANRETSNEALEKVTKALLNTGRVIEVSYRAADSAASLGVGQDRPPANEAIAAPKPDSLAKAWLHRVWDSRFRWPLIGLATLLAILFALWISLPEQAKMQLWNRLWRAIGKQP